MNRRSLFPLLVALLVVAPLGAQEEPASAFFTTSDGVRIHYLTAGDQGSWVVLVHGYTDSARRMWFSTGIAPVLAERHRVVALDNRNHGESDDPEPNGRGRPEDVTELMDHLGIQRAHIHGYSMGGQITRVLLATHPERFITAGFGGSGVRDEDRMLAGIASRMDRNGPAPEGAAARAFDNLRARAAQRATVEAANSSPFEVAIDLSALDVPVIAINGEYDQPRAKTIRMWRDLKTFQNVVLPGLNHMTAIAVGGPMPEAYIRAMAGFIEMYDAR